MTNDTQPFANQDRSEFCPVCHQHFVCNDCTPERRNDRVDAPCDNFRPRDMGRLDWSVLDFYRWQNERRV